MLSDSVAKTLGYLTEGALQRLPGAGFGRGWANEVAGRVPFSHHSRPPSQIVRRGYGGTAILKVWGPGPKRLALPVFAPWLGALGPARWPFNAAMPCPFQLSEGCRGMSCMLTAWRGTAQHGDLTIAMTKVETEPVAWAFTDNRCTACYSDRRAGCFMSPRRLPRSLSSGLTIEMGRLEYRFCQDLLLSQSQAVHREGWKKACWAGVATRQPGWRLRGTAPAQRALSPRMGADSSGEMLYEST
jgi:hypothetical protein